MDFSREAAILLTDVGQARTERRTIPTEPLDVDIGEAYLVQAELGEGRELKGYKLGLLSPDKQAQMGINSPIYGRVYSDMLLESPVKLNRFIQPRLEPEVAVVLDHDVTPDMSPEEARGAVGRAFLGVDFLDSVWEGYNFGISDVVADNASGGGFLLGDQPLSTPFDGELRLYLDGDLLTEGPLEALGDVGKRLSWLAGEIGWISEDMGVLEAGQVIFLGSPAASLEARPGTLELKGPGDSVLIAELED